MIRRLYVHNYRCLENFELRLADMPSVLLIGKNGSGKSTVAAALEIFQKLARNNTVDELVRPKDLAFGRQRVPVRFEIEFDRHSHIYGYSIAFEWVDGQRGLQVLDESFSIDGTSVYTRDGAAVSLGGTKFPISPHVTFLALYQGPSDFFVGKLWLSQMLILRPVPSVISGDSERDTLEPDVEVGNFGAWFAGVISTFPSAYSKVEEYLRPLMKDLSDIRHPQVGGRARSMVVRFSNDQGAMSVSFGDLSDGEKCFMIGALVRAANFAYGPLFCFWDEPDNYLGLGEVQHFVMDLRRGFQSGGQFIATSHNPEAISCFSEDNTLYLHRKSHLEPTTVRPVSELNVGGDLVDALARGDVEP